MQSSLFFESLFKRNTADAGNAAYLKQLAEEHPYFSPVQFYLLQQANTNSEEYTKQAAKTATLFNNPYWLNFQLLRVQQTVETTSPAFSAEETKISVVENILEEPQQEEIFVPVVTNALIDTTKTPKIIQSEEKGNNGNHVNGEGNELVFQPLYTSDYFASQGIKLSEEVQPNDKLGQQLRSFTDWLKTMKKIAPKIQIDHTIQNDSTIQTLAEKSNAEGDVLTETMADIFIQQGKAEKAIETYEKLSLLNPGKSAYFAAKIEHLKE